jgi:hypothetical protein
MPTPDNRYSVTFTRADEPRRPNTGEIMWSESRELDDVGGYDNLAATILAPDGNPS